MAIYCVFCRNLRVFFGVNFILQKFCSCKKNDKYEVWCSSSRNSLRGIHPVHPLTHSSPTFWARAVLPPSPMLLFWGNSSLGKVKRNRKIFPIHFFQGRANYQSGGLIQLLPASYGVKVSKLGQYVCNTRLDNTPCYQRFMLHQSQSGAVPPEVRALNK